MEAAMAEGNADLVGEAQHGGCAGDTPWLLLLPCCLFGLSALAEAAQATVVVVYATLQFSSMSNQSVSTLKVQKPRKISITKPS
jgi:hypothetical protein